MSTSAIFDRPASWEDARGADGPKVVAYLEKHDLITPLSFDEAIGRPSAAGDRAAWPSSTPSTGRCAGSEFTPRNSPARYGRTAAGRSPGMAGARSERPHRRGPPPAFATARGAPLAATPAAASGAGTATAVTARGSRPRAPITELQAPAAVPPARSARHERGRSRPGGRTTLARARPARGPRGPRATTPGWTANERQNTDGKEKRKDTCQPLSHRPDRV